jgi:hypothetical protein
MRGIRLPLPDVRGSDKEQLRAIRSYLYALVPELQWALDTAEGAEEEKARPADVPAKTAVLHARAADIGGAGNVQYTVLGGWVSLDVRCTPTENAPVAILPETARPKTSVSALCPAKFENGADGVACVRIEPSGEVLVPWAHGFGEASGNPTAQGNVTFVKNHE